MRVSVSACASSTSLGPFQLAEVHFERENVSRSKSGLEFMHTQAVFFSQIGLFGI